MAQNDQSDEITSIESKAKSDPYNAEALKDLADAYADQNRWDEAIHQYEIAVRLDPNNSDLVNNLGIAYEESGKFDEAERTYRQAITLGPNNPKPYFNLGGMYEKQHLLEKAVQAYQDSMQHTSAYDERLEIKNIIASLARETPAIGQRTPSNLNAAPIAKSGHYPTQQEMWQLTNYLESIGEPIDSISNAWVSKGRIRAEIGTGLKSHTVTLRISDPAKPTALRIIGGLVIAFLVVLYAPVQGVYILQDAYSHKFIDLDATISLALYIVFPLTAFLAGIIIGYANKARGWIAGLGLSIAVILQVYYKLSISILNPHSFEDWAVLLLVLSAGLFGGILGQAWATREA